MSNFPKLGLALVAPSGCAADSADLQQGYQHLAEQNYVLHNYYQHEARMQRFGASDAERVAQLHAAASNPEVQIVMALRGSYGLSRILHLLDYELLAASGKLFIGYSDFTALNLALLAKTGAMSISGPMLCDDFTRADLEPYTLQNLRACLHGPTHIVSSAQPQTEELQLEGVLWGGNLAMLVHLLGTPYMPKVKDGLLFVEDVAEHPYRIERMLLQLLHAGVLAQQRALILGDFSNYRLSPFDNGYDFAAMLAFLRAEFARQGLRLPILTGLPYGHVRQRASLVVGAPTVLQAGEAGFSLTMQNYPCVSRVTG